MKDQAGYTLLELLVVLVILSLLVAAIPGTALPGVDAVRFSGKVQDIESRLDDAHEKAIDEGQTIILKQGDLLVPGVVISLPSPSSEVIFFPDGSASGMMVTITSYVRSHRIIINSIDGLIEGK